MSKQMHSASMSRRSVRGLIAALAALIILAACRTPGAPENGGRTAGQKGRSTGSDFRVLPYQQRPTARGITVNWFTEDHTAGRLTLSGGDLSSPRVFTSVPAAPAIIQGYDSREREQAAENGYPLFSDANWKHSIVIDGLTPGTAYNYSVAQGISTFENTLQVPPAMENWSSIRFIVMSDSETEPRGRTNKRDWSPGIQAPGSLGRPEDWPRDDSDRYLYMLTETVGYRENMRIVNERSPHFVMMPGDLVQGGGYQQGWDEFWRHNAGEYDTSFSDKPLLPAYGNWENYAAVNGAYGEPENRLPVAVSRHKYKAYFDLPGNGTANHQDNYYRVDYGPLTIITLDSSNGQPDQVTRREGIELDTDTQFAYTAAEYSSAVAAADPALGLINDTADIGPGSTQFVWARREIKDARENNRIVFVQWHHMAYSSGTHGFPMSHADSSGQAGTPMRQYHPMFEELGVAAVFAGHSEMFERSFVDEDGDGVGVHYFDVGVAGDGMRGRALDSVTGKIGGHNPFSQWTADGDSGELWQRVNDDAGVSFVQLADGGKHYGHLEVNLEKNPGRADAPAVVTFTPVYSFPLLDSAGELIGGRTERRVYADEFSLQMGSNGAVLRF